MHTIQVKSKQIGTGKKAFIAHKALFGNLWVDIKFKKSSKNYVQDEPTGEYLHVNAQDINITVNDNGYPVIWIK